MAGQTWDAFVGLPGLTPPHLGLTPPYLFARVRHHRAGIAERKHWHSPGRMTYFLSANREPATKRSHRRLKREFPLKRGTHTSTRDHKNKSTSNKRFNAKIASVSGIVLGIALVGAHHERPVFRF